MSNFPVKSVTMVYGSVLLALRGGGLVSIFQTKKRYVTLEWPPVQRVQQDTSKLRRTRYKV